MQINQVTSIFSNDSVHLTIELLQSLELIQFCFDDIFRFAIILRGKGRLHVLKVRYYQSR